jgi:hypothetical protein
MLGRSFGSVDEYSQFIAPSEKYAGHLSQDTVFERFVSDSPPEFREFFVQMFPFRKFNRMQVIFLFACTI